jgi:hypothetical protein
VFSAQGAVEGCVSFNPSTILKALNSKGECLPVRTLNRLSELGKVGTDGMGKANRVRMNILIASQSKEVPTGAVCRPEQSDWLADTMSRANI